MKTFAPALLLLLALGASAPLLAQEQRHHEAHEHGVGQLNIAVEGTEIHLDLDSPAMNIVGFEHAPSTEADHQALAQAIARLKDGEQLFSFPSEAGCRLAAVTVQTPLLDHDGGEVHGKEESAGHEHHGETHADIIAEYRFTCAHPDKLGQVTVELFRLFPATERLKVQFITETRQGGAELNASNPVLSF
jgi:hypothetical protein